MRKYDAVIVVPDEGYTADIYSKAVKIYKMLVKKGLIPLIMVSGATRNPEKIKSYGLKKYLEKFFEIIPVQEQIEGLRSQGVSADDIVYESESLNTRENAVNSLNIIKNNIHTNVIYLVGSAEVILRKYLTFKKVIKDINLNVEIRLASVIQPFTIRLIAVRMLLVPGEFGRIIKYHKLGHI